MAEHTHFPEPDPSTPPEGGPMPTDHETEIAAHGLLDRIRLTRLHHSENIIEKMDRKDTLYAHLGRVASHKTSHEDGPKPKTIAERVIDWRMERKGWKLAVADIRDTRSQEVYGKDMSKHTPSVRYAATRKVVAPLSDKNPSLAASIVNNTVRFIAGPKIHGKGKFIRKLERANVRIQAAIGRKTAREATLELAKISATPVKLGSKTHRISRHRMRRRDELMQLAVDQPILSRWRNFRRNGAEKRAARLRAKLEASGIHTEETDE